MPLYEYRCPVCEDLVEDYAPTRAQAVAPTHEHGGLTVPLDRVFSVPSQHVLTGADQRARIGEKIKRKNVDYWASKRGIETIREDRSGQIDLTTLAR